MHPADNNAFVLVPGRQMGLSGVCTLKLCNLLAVRCLCRDVSLLFTMQASLHIKLACACSCTLQSCQLLKFWQSFLLEAIPQLATRCCSVTSPCYALCGSDARILQSFLEAGHGCFGGPLEVAAIHAVPGY